MANVAASVHVLVICRSSLNCKKVCLRFQKVSSLERFDRNGFSIEEMLKLCAIDEARLEAAETLLSKGFPSRSRAFWRKGLRRLADQNRAAGQPSVGFFLLAGETPVGILLTISRWDAQTGRRIVNLSSWYVEENHRWSATRLIMAGLADKEAIYTDLTPTPAAVEINNRFGFRSIGFDLSLVVLPWLALAGPRQGRLRPLEAVPAGALAETLLRDLRNHLALGCIVVAVEVNGRYHPIVLSVTSRKRIPVARVVFAENQDIVADNLGALARLLVLRGVPVLALQVEEGRNVPYAWIWKRGLCYQVKGDWDDRLIDELYSERVLLKM
ncbi:hypothetical protein P9A16_14575 [Shinella sp. 838]|uniref:hypothetical protein n=1 Tax=unclassified Shinella TaxID=2643062 RepID=UPI0003C56174|nr:MULTISPECIES: hypothetical protein [unclassified Shinella]MCA0344587.1 hypothetical protein [Pseudomonadota bacterium]MDG4672353.1 hypothetical protein [Shinella sp. 838]